MNSRYCPLCFYALPDDPQAVMVVSIAGHPMARVHREPCGTTAMVAAQAATDAATTAVTAAVRRRFPVAGLVLDGIQKLRSLHHHAAPNRRAT